MRYLIHKNQISGKSSESISEKEAEKLGIELLGYPGDHYGEPHFKFVPGNATDPAEKGKYEKAQDGKVYYRCPWCRAINWVEPHYVCESGVSLWCSDHRTCGRHLTITFKRRKE